MVRLTGKQLDEEIKKQEQEFGDIDDYYNQDIVGKDTGDDIKAVTGDDPTDDGVNEPFSIADEVDKDEEAIEDGSDNQREIVDLEDIDEEDL